SLLTVIARRTEFRFYACDRHREILRDAEDILVFMSDLQNDRDHKLQLTEERDAALRCWIDMFVQRTSPIDLLDPETLSKKAYEFAHAMIGREEEYKRLIQGNQFDIEREHDRKYGHLPKRRIHLLGYERRTYIHEPDLLKSWRDVEEET